MFCLTGFSSSVEAQERGDWRNEIQTVTAFQIVRENGFFLTVQGVEWLVADLEDYRLLNNSLTLDIQSLTLDVQRLNEQVQSLTSRTETLQDELDNSLRWNSEIRLQHADEMVELRQTSFKRFWTGFGIGLASGLLPFILVITLK